MGIPAGRYCHSHQRYCYRAAESGNHKEGNRKEPFATQATEKDTLRYPPSKQTATMAREKRREKAVGCRSFCQKLPYTDTNQFVYSGVCVEKHGWRARSVSSRFDSRHVGSKSRAKSTTQSDRAGEHAHNAPGIITVPRILSYPRAKRGLCWRQRRQCEREGRLEVLTEKFLPRRGPTLACESRRLFRKGGSERTV